MSYIIANTDATLLGTDDRYMNICRHLYFSFDFVCGVNVPEDLGAQFEIRSAPASEGNPCIPGEFSPIPELPECLTIGELADNSIIVIPGPLSPGDRCKATIRCANGCFVQVIPAETPDPNYPSGVEGAFEVYGLVQYPK